MEVSIITSGGSTRMFRKVNAVGEKAFCPKAVDATRDYSEI